MGMAHIVHALRDSGCFRPDQTTLKMGQDPLWRAERLSVIASKYVVDAIDETSIGNILYLHTVGLSAEQILIENWMRDWFRSMVHSAKDDTRE